MKNYKRSGIIILLMAVVLCACIALVACNDKPVEPTSPTAPHEHDYVFKSETPATCTAAGSKLYECSCGDSYTEPIAALGHDIHWHSVEGEQYHWQECSRCDYKTAEQEHVFEVVRVDKQPTCTEEGSQVVKCVCGASETQPITRLGHSYTFANHDDTYHWTECARCHTELAGSRVTHQYDITVSYTPSTCRTQGSSVTSCSCGQTHTEQLRLADHSYEWMSDDTEHWMQCSECSTVQADSRMTHSYTVDEELSTDVTCTEDGVTVKHCACGKTVTDTQTALGHDFDKSEFVKYNNAGHFYKCTRCEETLFETHTLEDIECADGYNKAPTCKETGHQDRRCTLCGHSFHDTIPATGEHTPAAEYTSNGTHHWHACTVCGEELDKELHSGWAEKVVKEPTCTDSGTAQVQCEVCGHARSNRSIQPNGHDFEYDEDTRIDATCEDYGSVDKVCKTCGLRENEQLKPQGHDWGKEWYHDDTGHWHKCTRCGADRDKTNHTPRETERLQEPTCTQSGQARYRCDVCEAEWTAELPQTQHDFRVDEDSYVESTCTVAGYHYKECTKCHARERVDDPLAEHQLVEYKAQDRTETQDGWRHHWKCTVCGKYFTSHDCHEELSEDEVFDRNPQVIEVESLAELQAIAREQYTTQQSKNYYKVTATVYIVDKNSLMVIDGDDDSVFISLYLAGNVDLGNINEGDIVTVKGFLMMDSYDDIGLYEAVILSVQGDSDIFSLHVTVTDNYHRSTLYAVSETGEYFSLANFSSDCQKDYYSCLLLGEKLTFYYECYMDVKVRSIIINGESQTMTNGELVVEVTGDMYCEFDLNPYQELNAVIEEFDLPWNAPEQKVNGYLRYQIVNNTAENGHLGRNSRLRITVTNAYIVRVTIEFENENLTEVAKNTIYVGTDANHKQSTSYTLNNTQAKLEFDSSQHLGYFEYSADASQARIKSITVYYSTYNT